MAGKSTATYVTVICKDKTLSFKAALRLADELTGRCFSKTAYLVLANVTRATTAGLARLAAVRAHLLVEGRDLRIIGLRGRARAFYDIYRMNNLLPEGPGDARRLERSPSWLASPPAVFTTPGAGSSRPSGRVMPGSSGT